MCNSHTLDDISHLLKDTKHFNVFDATKVFFHLPIDAMSRLLTVMMTPEGVYVFNILAMGLCNVGNLFESALCELLSGLSGVTNIADDILVYGSTQEEHDANVVCFINIGRDATGFSPSTKICLIKIMLPIHFIQKKFLRPLEQYKDS